MNVLAVLEVLGVAATAMGLAFALRDTRTISVASRITLCAILVLVLTLHAFDLAEWTGYPEADRYGDMLKVLAPIFWILFLFFLTRDRLLSRVFEQGQQLDFFLFQAPMAIAIFDGELRYANCSQKWLDLFGLTRVPLGEPLQATSPDLGSELHFSARQSLESRLSMDGLVRSQRNGKDTWYEWHFQPLTPLDSSGLLLVVEDATRKVEEQAEREKAQDQLVKKQSLELLGQIAGEVAHDLNNLLQVIHTHASILEADARQSPELDESLASIREAVQSASGMTRWLLALRRGREPALGRHDLSSLIRPTTDFLRRALPRSISVEVSVPPEPTWVWAEPTLIEQLVVNLVLNARDAMPHGGKIQVAVDETGTNIRLSVADEGEGIADDIRSRILEPMFTTKGDRGTGLGLVVVQRVAHFHGAQLTFLSEMGHGTTFAVEFRRWDAWTPEGQTQLTTTSRWPRLPPPN